MQSILLRSLRHSDFTSRENVILQFVFTSIMQWSVAIYFCEIAFTKKSYFSAIGVSKYFVGILSKASFNGFIKVR